MGGVEYTFAERVGRAEDYIEAIPDHHLSRDGHHGHDALFRVLKIIVNDFAVRDPNTVQRLADAYNNRLLSRDRWSEEDLDRKIDQAIDADPDPEYPFGCKLADRGPPREWKNSERLAEAFAERHTVRFVRETAFIYTRGHYQTLSDAALTAKVWAVAKCAAKAEFCRLKENWYDARETLDRTNSTAVAKHAKAEPKAAPNVTRAIVADAMQAVRAAYQLPDDTDPTAGVDGKLVVGNGVLDLHTCELSPHSPAMFTLTALSTAFDPAVTCPKWLVFVADVTGGDVETAAVLQEVFGATLDAHLPPKFFAMLTGTGDNGKSVVLNVLRTVLGNRNCAAVPLDDLTGSRFAKFGLLGKLANVVGDQGYFDSADEGQLKTLTGGDLVTFEQKNRDPLQAVNRAKIILSANNPPTFGDKSNAVWNRLVQIPFTWTCPADKKNPALLTAAHWDAEAPGILNWMLEGLQRFGANWCKFTRSAACEQAAAELRDESNPLAVFLRERYRERIGDFESTQIILQKYDTWCSENGGSGPPRGIVVL